MKGSALLLWLPIGPPPLVMWMSAAMIMDGKAMERERGREAAVRPLTKCRFNFNRPCLRNTTQYE